jgi:hypothetical protein
MHSTPLSGPIALAALLALVTASPLSAQSNPCALLTTAEAVKHIARGRPTYDQAPDATVVSGGALCQYPFGGQIGVWRGPGAEANLEQFLRSWKADKERRHPVSGVGDRAWIMFPVPASRYKDRGAYLVTYVGQQIVTVALFAHKGNAESSLGEICRNDPGRLKPKEREDCKRILADKSETPESLQPAVVELAKLLVAKVRAAKPS